MRLLHSKTLHFHEFVGSHIPPYAILSHRWEDEEVIFADMQKRDCEGKAGYDKIKKCCAQAITDNLDYIWVDTCCIDKSSSAELSEAINSMFQWYKNAAVCYAYLSDVNPNLDQNARSAGEQWMTNNSSAKTQVSESLWFTRGWTLQELLAPASVIFFANVGYMYGWVRIGSKDSLSHLIAGCTGIDEAVLLGQSVQSCSVATRMSWAAQRQTTREEDKAYCLLGLFKVNMPLLYGEGSYAFIRLQEEIMKRSDDQSLFAWELDVASTMSGLSGLLATSPSQFRKSSSIFAIPDLWSQTPYQMTNRGLRIELPILPGTGPDDRECLAILQCTRPLHGRIALPLLRLNNHPNMYCARHGRNNGQLLTVGQHDIFRATNRIIFIRQDPEDTLANLQRRSGIFVRFNSPHAETFTPIFVGPHMRRLPSYSTDWSHFYLSPPLRRGLILFSGPRGSRVAVLFHTGSSAELACKAFAYVPESANSLDPSLQLSPQSRLVQALSAGTSTIAQERTSSHQISFHDPASEATISLDVLLQLFEHLAVGSCTQSFDYLAIGYAVGVELRPDVVGAQHVFALDIRFQDQDALTYGPYELDATGCAVANREA